MPVLTPCLRAEQLHITIDTHTGMFRCHVPKHLDCPIVLDMQNCLNSDRSKMQHLLSELRYLLSFEVSLSGCILNVFCFCRFWITHRRCEKTLQHLPATAVESLTFLTLPSNSLMQSGRHKIYVKLHRHPNVILVSKALCALFGFTF